ncbi:hypothetical protein ACA758_00090 [Mycoplasmopsis agassizii]|uniref:hypothetical protein n=1 Tax=Mycoplasmopsis agassizii TaxID=33922 RepID=UPI0035285B96
MLNRKTWLLKIILPLSTIGLTALGVAGAIGFKSVHPPKKVFLNFANYAADSNIAKISENFTYRTYADINDFRDQLLSQKIAAGITSSYQIFTFIELGLVRPINYDAFFNLEGDAARGKAFYNADWARATYTDAVFQQLSFFDQFFQEEKLKKTLEERYGTDQPLHMWNFMVPYFTQDKILAYDYRDIDQSKLTDQEKANFEIDFDTRIANSTTLTAQEKANGRDFKNLFTILRDFIPQDSLIQIHDEMRDNIAYGSEDVVAQNQENFDGKLGLSTYQTYVNDFINNVQSGLNTTLKDTARILFNNDSSNILNSLVDQNLNTSVGVIYNGDALDAFFAVDNDDDLRNSSGYDRTPIRIVNLKSRITLTDGYIIPSYLTDQEANEVARLAHQDIYDGWYAEDYNGISGLPTGLLGTYQDNDSTEEVAMYDEDEESFSKPGFENFFFVNYTPPTKIANNIVFYNQVADPSAEQLANKSELYKDNYIAWQLEQSDYGYEKPTENYDNSDFAKFVNIASEMGVVNFDGIEVPAFMHPASDLLVSAAQVYYVNRFKT